MAASNNKASRCPTEGVEDWDIIVLVNRLTASELSGQE